MKIIGIQSSPKGKNSNTLKLLNAAMEGAAEAGAETEIIDVTKLQINYCLGCVSCYSKGVCAQKKDDFSQVWEKILAADGIILSSPNYVDSVTGQMKTLLDRMTNTVHEQLFDGKYGFSISTAGGPSADLVANYLNTYFTKSGGNAIGIVFASNSQGATWLEDGEKKARDMGKELAKSIREKKAYPAQDAVHKEFRKSFGMTLKFNKDRWQHNYEHWVEKGWIKV